MAPPSRLEGFREGRGWGRIPPVLLHGGNMDTYYKYSSLMSVDFFENPTIKISTPAHLNDPYECQPSSNIKQAMEVILNKPCPEHYIEAISHMIQSNGIVSLSETQRNSLMWAHYGDHHKGMCIGFKPDFIKKTDVQLADDESLFSDYCMSILTPRKVNYDNYRFDINRKLSSDDIIPDAFLRHFLTKSDEWIYEKEHRCILSYLHATHILAKDLNEKIIVKSLGKHLVIHAKKAISSLLEIKAITKTKKPNLYKINGNKVSLVMLSTLAEFPSISFLQEIDPNSITEIYFGCRAPKEKVKAIYTLIKNDRHPLKHVNLHYFSIGKERFELTAKTLNDDYFNMD